MKLHLFAIGCVAMLAEPATAQTLNCTTFGNSTTCRQQQQVDTSIPLRAGQRNWSLGEILQRSEAEPQTQDTAPPQESGDSEMYARMSRQVHAAVGKYLKQGKCTEAMNFALEWGEVELANQAKDFCAKPAP